MYCKLILHVEVRNKFDLQQKLNGSNIEKYQKFIEANNYAARKILLIAARKTSNLASCDQRVVNARQKTKAAFNLYCVNTNEYNRLGYEPAKKKLEKTYNIVTEKDLSENIKVIEESNMIGKHRKSWKLINKISGRITCRKSQINGATITKRIENWFKHL